MDRLFATHTSVSTARRSQDFSEWLHEEHELDRTHGIRFQKMVVEARAGLQDRVSAVAQNIFLG